MKIIKLLNTETCDLVGSMGTLEDFTVLGWKFRVSAFVISLGWRKCSLLPLSSRFMAQWWVAQLTVQ